MPAMAARPDRAVALLDATLRLLGRGGLATVTHRAVEAEAGLPHGSTTYYFKSRQQLVDAAVERLLELDHEQADGMAHEVAMALARGPGRPDYARIATWVTAWLRTGRTLHLARYELYLAGARRVEIRERIAAGRATFLRLVTPLVVALGSEEPDRDAGLLLAQLDGLMFAELARSGPDGEPEIDARAMERLIEAFRRP